MSHGDIRRATAGLKAHGKQGKVEGLWECYQSRVENGWVEPGLSTLEKWAAGLNMPLWRLLVELVIDNQQERKEAIHEVRERLQEQAQESAPAEAFQQAIPTDISTETY